VDCLTQNSLNVNLTSPARRPPFTCKCFTDKRRRYETARRARRWVFMSLTEGDYDVN